MLIRPAAKEESAEEEAVPEVLKRPAAKASKKAKTKGWGASAFIEITGVLPERCRPSPETGPQAKSYMVKVGPDLKLPVQALLAKRAFYVKDVHRIEAIPTGCSLNKLGCVQVGWKQSIEAAWVTVMDLAK